MTNDYPLCRQYNLTCDYDGTTPYIPWQTVESLPDDLYLKVYEGLERQTCHINGPYPWDVEKILWRLQ